MGAFTDFPNGIQSASDYLTDNVGASAQLSTSVADIAGFMVSAEMDFNLKEIVCSLLAGRGLLLPNIQICVSLNLKELLSTVLGTITDTLYAALASLDQTFDKLMDHLRIDEVLGRINNVLSEISNIANMINFCSAPINPIRIPNVLENVMESFLGAGKSIVDSIGQMVPDQIGGCLIGGTFNGSVFSGGLLKKIWDNIDNLNAIEATLLNDIALIESAINGLIERETQVTTKYDQGGSDDPEAIARLVNPDMGVHMGPDQIASVSDAYRIAELLRGIDSQTRNYDLFDDEGNRKSICELICEPTLLAKLRQLTDPKPTIAEQQPVYNYCGEIVGYTQSFAQQDEQTSKGVVPTAINAPGYLNGTLPTSEAEILAAIAAAGSSSSGDTTVVISNNYTVDGATLFVADAAGVLNSGATEGQMVFRADNGVTYLRNGVNLGTIADDYEVVGGGTGGTTLGTFLTNVDNSTGTGLLVRSGDVPLYRTMFGTANQITVTNGSGVNGSPVIGLSSNPIIPGTDSMVLPNGTTGQRISTTNGAIRYNTTTGTFEGYQTGAWAAFATGAGSVTNGSNIGGGTYEVFKQNNAGVLEFRTFAVSGGITLGVAADVITVGESLTSSSLGAGSNVFKQRTANDFEFRSLTAGTNITLTESANSIEISSPNTNSEGTVNTTTATATEVLFDGTRLTPASGSLWFVTVTAVANRSDANDATAIKIEGLVDNNSGTVTIVGTAGNKTVYNSTASTVNYDLLLDVTANQFRVRVQGETAHTVDWKVKLDYIESP